MGRMPTVTDHLLKRCDMHRYQYRAIDFVKDNPFCALFLDMGLGKTIIALTATIDLLNAKDITKILVIAPLRVAKHTWPSEINNWAHTFGLPYSLIVGSKEVRARAAVNDAPLHIVNRENVAWLVEYWGKDWPYDCVIVDESSSFKNNRAVRYRALKKARRYIKRMIQLTGTPAPNGLLDLWAPMYLLDLGKRLLPTFTAYRNAYFSCNPYSPFPDYKLLPGSDKFIYKRIEDITLRLDVNDYLDLPDVVNTFINIDLPEKVAERYKDFERHCLLELENSATPITVLSAAHLVNKLLQFANGAIYDENRNVIELHNEKIDALSELYEASQGQSLLVAYNFKFDLDRLQSRFPDAVVLDADSDCIDRWNKGEIKMLLCHPASCGHGLNLQAGGSIVVWYGLNWSLELYQQFNARLHRIGQTNMVTIVHLVANNTVDEQVISALTDKATTQADLLNTLRAKHGV